MCRRSLSNSHHFFVSFIYFLFFLQKKPPHLLSLQNHSSVGASIQFSCDDSYVLQGSKSITCQRVTETLAAWSDHRPICRSECECGSEQTLSVKMLSDPVKWDVQCIARGRKSAPSSIFALIYMQDQKYTRIAWIINPVVMKVLKYLL